ncbi:MAG: NAD(+)/NADH kinase [Clostridia bacterium]|nr:NAD(+)/NADH kinase [Clostridia bacterium]
MKIGIFSSKNKPEAEYYVSNLDEVLRKEAAERGISLETERFITSKTREDSDAFDGLSLGVSIGGDGTFLHAARFAAAHDFPVLGINLGKLGFLTEINKNTLEGMSRHLLEGDYTIETRRMLKVVVKNESGETTVEDYALNDCVIQRDTFAKIMYADAYINGIFVTSYACDGIVIATQTGSTAYSYAAGGPVVEPGCDVSVITPLNAHFTDSHSLVINSGSTVEFRLLGKAGSVALTADGRINRFFKEGETVFCCLAPERTVKMIRINPPTFYETLSEKLRQRGEKRNG